LHGHGPRVINLVIYSFVRLFLKLFLEKRSITVREKRYGNFLFNARNGQTYRTNREDKI
jgi:hypothetical protein